MNGGNNRALVFATWIILVIVIVVFTVFYFQTSSRIADNENSISALDTQTTSLQSQLSSANSNISSLGDQLASQISSLKGQLSSASSQIASLSQQLNNAGSQIAALQDQTSSSSSQISTLQSQLSSLSTQLTSLQSTVNTLSAQVTSLSSTSYLTTLFSSQSISQGPNTYTTVYTFAPAYSGSIYITGTSSSATGYIMIINNSTGASSSYAFGTGTTVTVPLTAGYNYTIYFGNHDSYGTITATLTGTYSRSTSTYYPTTLFSSQYISQGPNTYTAVYTFAPTYSGSIYITGTSSSATGYIMIINNSTGASSSYTFGTGTTVTVPLITGYNYTIYFGNHDSYGTITATLTGTYQQ